MKRSELKEAIKAEITSVLLENESKSAVHSLGKDLYDYLTNVVKMKGSLSSPIKADTINKGQQFTVLINDNNGKFDSVKLYIPVGKDNINKEYIQKNIVDQVKRKYKELETKITQIDSTGNNKAMVNFTLTGPNLFQKVSEAMSDEEKENRIQHLMRTGAKEKPLRKLAAIGKKEEEKVDEIGNFHDPRMSSGNFDHLTPEKEGKKGVVVDPDEIMMHINQYQSGNIDGDDLAQAIEEILVAMMNAPLNEDEDEPTAADLKKKDSVASISNKLQKLTAKMKKKAKEFKEAEGKAKDKIKDELKDMTAEKKKLEKDL